eukprot:1348315-Alexandrium_andersonii.AAC.1
MWEVLPTGVALRGVRPTLSPLPSRGGVQALYMKFVRPFGEARTLATSCWWVARHSSCHGVGRA